MHEIESGLDMNKGITPRGYWPSKLSLMKKGDSIKIERHNQVAHFRAVARRAGIKTAERKCNGFWRVFRI